MRYNDKFENKSNILFGLEHKLRYLRYLQIFNVLVAV